jgi:segregation and condensation protein B
MNDDLAAKAANWVPPWQRPADEQSGPSDAEDVAGEVEPTPGPGSAPESRGQWDRLAGAKWQTVRQGESVEDSEVDDGPPLDPELSDPQLSDCLTEDDDSELEDGEAGSWNARKPSRQDTDDEADAEDEADADDGADVEDEADADDKAVRDADADGDELSEDERVAAVLSGEGAGDEPAGDEPVAAALSEDGVALSEDERVAAVLSGEGAGDEPAGGSAAAALSGEGVGDEPAGGSAVAALSGEGGRSGGKRPRGKRSGGGEGQPEAGEDAGGALGQGQLFVPAQRAPEEERPPLSEAELVPALEAILMVVDEPVGEILLAQVLEVPAERIADALLGLSAKYTQEGKGFDLRRAAGGWRFYTRAEYSAYVEKFVLDGQQLRLTQASLETLAVVAYKQPVTRSRISAIRGVNCDGVVRTLVTRGLIEECGTEPESGAHLYKTTNLFLEKLGLDSVAQLPPLAPFLPDNLDEVALNE